jgi:hypothetical protein
MRSFALKTTIFLVLLVGAPAARASEPEPPAPEKRALISELFTVTHLRQNSEAVLKIQLDQVDREMRQFFSQNLVTNKQVPPETRKFIQQNWQEMNHQFSRRFRNAFTRKIDYPRLTEEISADVYDRTFTADEIRDLIAFYRTPTGQKVIQSLPQVQTQVVNRVRERLLPIQQQIFKTVMDEQMRKWMAPPAPAKSPKARKKPST